MHRNNQRAAVVVVAAALIAGCQSDVTGPVEKPPVTGDIALAPNWTFSVNTPQAAALSAAVLDMADRIVPTLPESPETAALALALRDLKSALAQPEMVPGLVISRVVETLNGVRSDDAHAADLEVARLAMDRALDLSQTDNGRMQAKIREQLYAPSNIESLKGEAK